MTENDPSPEPLESPIRHVFVFATLLATSVYAVKLAEEIAKSLAKP